MRYFWSDLSGLLAVVYRAGEIHRLIDQQGARGLPLVDVIRRPSLTAAYPVVVQRFTLLRRHQLTKLLARVARFYARPTLQYFSFVLHVFSK